MDFYKKKNGEYLEGYLGKPGNFNGIVFMLKEPNQDAVNAAEEDRRYFWIKNAIYKEKIYEDDESKADKRSRSIRAGTYRNRFKEMLDFIGRSEKDLYDAVFCNVHPEFGAPTETKESKCNVKGNALEKIELLEQCGKNQREQNLIIFTCTNAYEVLKQKYIKDGHLLQEADGLEYKNGKILKKFYVITADCKITVYEILHPIRNPAIKVTKE